MSEPRTPTGKRLWGNKRRLMVPADILAIEAEAIAIGEANVMRDLQQAGRAVDPPTEAEEDAARLAEAGQRVMSDLDGGYEVGIGTTGQLVRALRLHDERVKP